MAGATLKCIERKMIVLRRTHCQIIQPRPFLPPVTSPAYLKTRIFKSRGSGTGYRWLTWITSVLKLICFLSRLRTLFSVTIGVITIMLKGWWCTVNWGSTWSNDIWGGNWPCTTTCSRIFPKNRKYSKYEIWLIIWRKNHLSCECSVPTRPSLRSLLMSYWFLLEHKCLNPNEH